MRMTILQTNGSRPQVLVPTRMATLSEWTGRESHSVAPGRCKKGRVEGHEGRRIDVFI